MHSRRRRRLSKVYDDAAKAIKIFGQYFYVAIYYYTKIAKNLHLEHLYQQYFLAAVGAADLSPWADRCYYPGRLLLSACYWAVKKWTPILQPF